MKKIQAIFFDIDGTLLNFDHTWPSSLFETLKAVKANGVKLFIATGRAYQDIPLIKKEMPEGIMDGWIAFNGQYCITEDGVEVRSVTIPNDEAQKAINYLIQQDIGTFIEERDQTFITKMSDDLPDNYKYFADLFEADFYNDKRLKHHPVYQLVPYIYRHQKDIEARMFSMMPGYKPARWNDLCVDVIPKSGGKDVGIDAMLEYFNIPLENTMAIGDGENDIDMIMHAGIGVAMGNAPERVKAIADYVTDDIDRDGIYKAMKHFKLLDQ